ncbi:MAG: GNAT family N-acetyltransferase [Planctomycetota bacterium]|jgi:putative acetyltransferase
MSIIRREQPQDIPEIRQVNIRAFGREQEASVVDKLRENCNSMLSFVALTDGKVVGHILFSPAVIEGRHGRLVGTGLAPLAVLPEYQRKGIGTQLMQTAIARIKESGCPYIIVIGHPEYYPRFGFEPADRSGISIDGNVPDEAFMILILDRKAMNGITGVARYREEWAEAM